MPGREKACARRVRFAMSSACRCLFPIFRFDLFIFLKTRGCQHERDSFVQGSISQGGADTEVSLAAVRADRYWGEAIAIRLKAIATSNKKLVAYE